MSVDPSQVTVLVTEVELEFEDLFATITRRIDETGAAWWDLTYVGSQVLACFAEDAYDDAVSMGQRYLAAAADGTEAIAAAMSEAQAAKDAVIPQSVDVKAPPVILKGGVLQQAVVDTPAPTPPVIPAGPVVVAQP